MRRPLLALLAVLLFAGCGSTDVTDDTLPTVAFDEAAMTVMEGENAVPVALRLTGEAATDVTVEVALDVSGGTADAADFDGFTVATVIFPAGASGGTLTFFFPVSADNVEEDGETAALVIQSVVGAEVGTPARLDLEVVDAFDPGLVDYDAIATPDFGDHVQPLLAARCGDCHGAGDPAGGLIATTWEGLVAGSDAGEALIAYDPDNSLLVEMMTKLPEGHPLYGAHRLREAEVALLRRWIEQGARDDDGAVPYASVGDGRLYVSNQMAGQVSVIDVGSLVVARNVSFAAYGGPSETNPHDTAVEPDGSAWYVSLINANRVLKVDAATNELAAEAVLDPTFKPGMLALDAQSDRIFAGRSFSDLSGGRSLYAIERAGMTPTEVAIPYTRPHPIAVTNDGDHLLSGSLADNVIASYDITGDEPELADLIEVGGPQKSFVHYALSPDGGVAAITSQLSRELYFIDVSDPENLRVLGIAAVGEQPWHPTYSPDGARVYVPNRLSNTVSVVDASDPANPSVLRTIESEAFAMPHGSAVTDDGRLLFVSSRNQSFADGTFRYTPRYPFGDNEAVGNVAVIDTQTFEVVKVLETEEFASGLSIYQP
jgi:YVTN family beta-propeller protein